MKLDDRMHLDESPTAKMFCEALIKLYVDEDSYGLERTINVKFQACVLIIKLGHV